MRLLVVEAAAPLNEGNKHGERECARLTEAVAEINMAEASTNLHVPNELPVNKRQQFGNRTLINQDDVFQHNAWDNVTWDKEQEEAAQRKVKENSKVCVSIQEITKYETDASKYWDKFYDIHQNRLLNNWHQTMLKKTKTGRSEIFQTCRTMIVIIS
ncbi:tRNA N(3)-methylcytidine methyltransferase METTL2-like [Phymastichus coffea]|uniref:tRNA N(3)-methylcytidine methyltransferase METTL2-like n=1 Tax=Phymastichus coffea TaxID=108790 RepID=UPI00273C44CE|nr:tRNA N(3)-methylcytidine methyltransferase METTL2-like [Phymastichus coffea]